jgi:hypothetical protein
MARRWGTMRSSTSCTCSNQRFDSRSGSRLRFSARILGFLPERAQVFAASTPSGSRSASVVTASETWAKKPCRAVPFEIGPNPDRVDSPSNPNVVVSCATITVSSPPHRSIVARWCGARICDARTPGLLSNRYVPSSPASSDSAFGKLSEGSRTSSPTTARRRCVRRRSPSSAPSNSPSMASRALTTIESQDHRSIRVASEMCGILRLL